MTTSAQPLEKLGMNRLTHKLHSWLSLYYRCSLIVFLVPPCPSLKGYYPKGDPPRSQFEIFRPWSMDGSDNSWWHVVTLQVEKHVASGSALIFLTSAHQAQSLGVVAGRESGSKPLR